MLKLRQWSGFLLGAAITFYGVCGDASAQSVYDDGHGDIGIAYEEGELELHWHIEGGTVDGVPRANEEFDAEELVAVTSLLFNDPAGRPSDPSWAPIGNAPGDITYLLPQASISGTPFLGLASEEMGLPSDWATDLTWTVSNFSGPGEFSIWQNGVTPDFFVSTADGLLSWTGPVGGHDHYNYGFTEAGLYDVELTVSATHATDGPVSDTASFRFSAVTSIPEPSGSALLATLGLGVLTRRRLPRHGIYKSKYF